MSAPLAALFTLTPHPTSANTFTTPPTTPLSVPPGASQLWGGLLASHSLLSATSTVPPSHAAYSLHIHFLAPGRTSTPIVYTVTAPRDSRSFSTRAIAAHQDGTLLSTAVASFQRRLPRGLAVVAHAPPMPAGLPPPEDVAPDADGDAHPFDWRRLPIAPAPPHEGVARAWVRSRGPVPDGQHLAALACLSDAWFIATVVRVHPAATGGRGERVGMMTSLDHGVRFCVPDVNVEGWLLVEARCEWAGEERAGVEMKVWRKEDGRLVARAGQEGLVRLRRDGGVGDGKGLGVPGLPGAIL
ncbi:thioesterase-like superfamily-domain-containing protein [Geopyxis carbonaria]|nr:thioesterase-like superfamily-domain-containing protein [Geopyxis carbonaria]